jgi:preprotein translocase subunit YajC
MAFLYVLIVLAILFWFIAIQPQRRRQRAHLAMQDAVTEGIEIITAGGLHGTIVEATDSIVRIEVAPGTVVRVDRRAVAAVVPPDDSEEEAPGEPEELEPEEEAPGRGQIDQAG